MAKKIQNPDLYHQKNANRFALADDLDAGQEAMIAKAQTYLPQEPKESPKAYNVRLNRTPFYPGFSDCLSYLTAALFRKDVMLGDDASKAQQEFSENVDLQGNNISVFARKVFRNAEKHGIGYILVDYPDLPEGLSLADERSMNARPYWRMITAPSLFFMQFGTVAGQEMPLEIRFYEQTTTVDEFEQVEVRTIRRFKQVITDGKPSGVSWEVWQQDAKNKEKYALARSGNLFPMKRIPLVPVYTEQDTFMRGAWRLEHCARLNVTHWQSSSDQRNILRVTRCPILAHAGFYQDPANPIEISPNSHQGTTKPDAKMWWVEHSGAAIGAGQTDLDNLERQMSQIGKSMALRKSGSITATESTITSAQSQSELQSHGKSLKDALENCFVLNEEWQNNGDSPCSVIVNTDFGILESDSGNNALLLTSAQGGKLSTRTYLSELKRRNLLSDDVDIDEEIERIKLEQDTNWLGQEDQGDEETGAEAGVEGQK